MLVMALVLFLIFSLGSCHRGRPAKADAITDRAAIPALATTDVTTLISDSGVTRYRIKAAVWEIYDKADPPYWEFPQGVYLEKFDSTLHVDASLQSDYAKYHESEERWELRGNVHALNLQGEQFDTPLLYWDQKTERVYSDSAITIRKSTSTIYGIGFESNQEMTKYTIKNPSGVIPMNEN